MRDFKELYKVLMDLYEPQGWWPLLKLHQKGGINPTKSGSINGYHPKDYSYPQTQQQQWEIIAGALLTQNTNWINVEKALINLESNHLLSAKSLINASLNDIKECIRPAGYFNQKSERLVALAQWFIQTKGTVPQREELLSLKGIGPETADSILCYAYKQPIFVVDAYSKRIFFKLNLIDESDTYETIRHKVESNLKGYTFDVFQEFHALLVEHAKRYYTKQPYGQNCPCTM